jgi:hypothetical protein
MRYEHYVKHKTYTANNKVMRIVWCVSNDYARHYKGHRKSWRAAVRVYSSIAHRSSMSTHTTADVSVVIARLQQLKYASVSMRYRIFVHVVQTYTHAYNSTDMCIVYCIYTSIRYVPWQW